MNTLFKPVAILATFISLYTGAPNAAVTIVAPNEVCVYEFRDYVGQHKCYKLYPNTRYKLVTDLGALNNKIESVQVGSDVQVTFFENNFFRSHNFTTNKHEPKLELYGFGNRANSLIVSPRPKNYPDISLPGVWAYENDRDRRRFFPLPVSIDKVEARYGNLGGLIKPEEIQISGNVEVTLYEDENFEGRMLTLPGEGHDYSQGYVTFNLAHFDFKHKASSLVVRVFNPIKEPLKVPITKIYAPPPRGGESTGEAHRAPPAGAPKATLPEPSSNAGQAQLPGSVDDMVWHCCAEPPIRCDFRLPPFDGKPQPRGTPCTCPGGYPGHACD